MVQNTIVPTTSVPEARHRRIDEITADLYAGTATPTALMRERDAWASVCAHVVAQRDEYPLTWEGTAADAADLYKYADDLLQEYFKSDLHAVRSGAVEAWSLSKNRAEFLATPAPEVRELRRSVDVTDHIEAVDL